MKNLRSHLSDMTIIGHECWITAYLASKSSMNVLLTGWYNVNKEQTETEV